MHSRSFVVLLLTVLLTLAGCSESHAPALDGAVPPGDGGAVREFVELCAQPELHCSRLYECATPSRLSLDQMLLGHHDEASCVVATGAFLGAYCNQIGAGLETGRSSVDLERLAACAEFRASRSCEEYLNDDPTTQPLCAGTPFITGLVASGGTCGADLECATAGEVCVSDGAPLGTCVAAPGEGEACHDGPQRCTYDLHCDGEICRAGCLYDSHCLDGWCDQPGNDHGASAFALGECAPFRGLGEECEDVLACESGLYCDDTNGLGPDGVRAPGNCAAPRAAGETCNESIDCISGTCTDDRCE